LPLERQFTLALVNDVPDIHLADALQWGNASGLAPPFGIPASSTATRAKLKMILQAWRQHRTLPVRKLCVGTVAAAFIATGSSCGADKATGPIPPNVAAAFAVTSDSLVILGGTLAITVRGSLSSLPANARIVWTSSDATVATVDNAGKVSGVGIGSVRISARLLVPDLDTGVVRSLDFRVKYKGIAIAAIDSLTGLGQTVNPVIQGLDTTGAARGTVAATLSSSDPSIVSVASLALTAVKNGSAAITASFDGATAQVAVKVRQVAKSVTFAATPLVIRSLERDTMVVIIVRDTRGNAMAGTPTWSATNAAVASVTATGVVRAHQTSATTIRVTVDTVTATLPVSVAQSISLIAKLAGDAQSQTAGTVIAVAPSVIIKDAGGVGIGGVPVTFTVATGGGSLVGSTVITEPSGIATVGSWTLGAAAGANSLTASAGSVSVSFAASGVAGAPFRVHFTSSPAGTLTNLVGATLARATIINVVDANDNIIAASTASVDLALIGPAGAASLIGTTTLSAVSGVAAYGALKVSTPSAGYRLVAAASGLAPDTSGAFTVLGPAMKLAFIAQPENAVSSSTLTGVTVAVQDAAGTTLSTATSSVTLTLGANPGGATLTGGTARAATAGIATFAGLRLNKAGTGYTLAASASGLTSATSNAFNITPGTAASLAFLVAPTSVTNGVAMTPSVQVAVVDADGNTVTSATGTISAAIAAGSGATLTNATASISSGVATFSSLTLTGTTGAYILQFSDGTRAVTSAAFALRVGAATALAFGTSPATTAINGAPLVPQPVVRVVDVSGNTVATAAGTMTTTITSGSGATLVGATATISSGIATFTTLGLNGTVGSFTLQFSDGTRSISAASIALSAGAAKALSFGTAPSTTAANGVALAAQPVVRVVDASGNTTTSATGTVTATIASGPGGTLASSSATIAGGIATLSGLTLNGPSGAYTIKFSDGTRTLTSGTITLGP
jgi:hypothetical protein